MEHKIASIKKKKRFVMFVT